MKTLAIRHSTSLPIREVSALAVRASAKGPELVAVGDEDFAVITSRLDADDVPREAYRHELWPFSQRSTS